MRKEQPYRQEHRYYRKAERGLPFFWGLVDPSQQRSAGRGAEGGCPYVPAAGTGPGAWAASGTLG